MANRRGQPTLYRDEYCERVIALLKEGCAMEEIALELDVHVDSLYEWMKKHEEFSDAIKKGRTFSKGWWLKQARISLRDKDFNPTTWYMNMKNRFGWKDKNEVEVSVDDTTNKIKETKKDYEKPF